MARSCVSAIGDGVWAMGRLPALVEAELVSEELRMDEARPIEILAGVVAADDS